MKKLLLILSFCLVPLLLGAQSDTLTIQKLRTYPAASMSHKPFMADSINIYGQEYNPAEMLAPVSHMNFSAPEMVTLDSQDGVFILPASDQSIFTYGVKLLTDRYENASLLIESNVPFLASLDGYQVAKRKSNEDEMSYAGSYPLYLTPSRSHLLALQALSSGEKEGKFRLRIVPSREDSSLEMRLDNKEYLSLEYMMTGKSLYSTSVSPTGKYVLLTTREMIAQKSYYQTVLYEQGTPKSQLPQDFQYAYWMPKSDLLYTTKTSDEGRDLVVFDPATLEVKTIASNLPEGEFYITPAEDALVMVVKQEGPRKGELIERVMGRYDNTSGYRDRSFLAHYDLKSGLYRPLTYGYRSTSLHSISPDGEEIIFSNSEPTTKSPFSQSSYYIMNLKSLEVEALFEEEASIGAIYHTSNPRYLLISGDANAFDGIGKNLPDGMVVNTYDSQLFLYDLEKQEAQALTKDFAPSVGSVSVLSDAFGAYFTAENGDRKSLYYLNLKSKEITQVRTSEDLVRSFDVDNKGKVIAYTGQSAMNSDRFYIFKGGKEQLVVDLSREKLKNIMLGEMHDWSHKMPNGDKVQGRYYLPPNFDPQKKYPMIVYYYGGTSPTSRFLEGAYSLPMYASQGYVVLTLNPSGTTGFGQEYSARHVNAWGQVTANEIVESVKGFCAEHSFVNAEKIGCMGASYGGFMTQYLQTITDIFAAAVSHAGISAISSYWGEGTWGIGYCTVANNESYPWNNPDLFVKQSPLFNADKINTPLLLLHGTADTNVPIGESVQMYNALKILGKEVEFIKVFGEDHIITDPAKKVEWTQSIFSWFQRWLKDDPTWWNDRNPQVNL